MTPMTAHPTFAASPIHSTAHVTLSISRVPPPRQLSLSREKHDSPLRISGEELPKLGQHRVVGVQQPGELFLALDQALEGGLREPTIHNLIQDCLNLLSLHNYSVV
jgi:hypothetical protein